MAKARSLKHLRYVLAGITPEDAILPNRVHYWTMPEHTGLGHGTWTDDLGGASIFQDYAEARDFFKHMQTKYPDLVEKNNIKVEIVPAKSAMMAKLRYDGGKGIEE